MYLFSVIRCRSACKGNTPSLAKSTSVPDGPFWKCKQLKLTVIPEQVLYDELFIYAEQNYDAGLFIYAEL